MYKQSILRPSALSRFFVTFIILLMLMLTLFVYNYFNAWLINKQNSIDNMSAGIAFQIEDYRYNANHLYKLANPENKSDEPSSLIAKQSLITQLRPDVFWLSSENQTIDAIIFGNGGKENNSLATMLANYMEIVWGARNDYNSVYYLDGKNNTLILVTTHSVLKPELRYKESYLTLTAEEKRADMLAQSTILDRREILSDIQKLKSDNLYFYTYRLMFNAPGKLTSIISFDISLKSIIPLDLQGKNLSLIQVNPGEDHSKIKNMVSIQGAQIIFSQPIQGTSYLLVYKLSLKETMLEILNKNIWLIICMILFTIFACGGSLYVRRRFISPNRTMYRELQTIDNINNDIINNVPYGLLVYDFSTNQKMISNGIANKLLPAIDLVHIRDMALQNHGNIQASIDNILYEITLVGSSMFDNTYLFILADKDNEALAQKKYILAEREYQKNIHLRKLVFDNMCHEVQPSLDELNYEIKDLLSVSNQENEFQLSVLLEHINYISHWFDNVKLLTQVETDLYTPNIKACSISNILQQFLQEKLFQLNKKGLKLYFHNNINPEDKFLIDDETLLNILSLTLDYSINTTSFGKIALKLNYDAETKEIIIDIMDSGYGLTQADISNMQIPFSSSVTNERKLSRSGMTLYLCRMLCKKMQGNLTIRSKIGIGTHYVLTFTIEEANQYAEYPLLLEDINIFLKINNVEIENIVKNTLSKYGAIFITPQKTVGNTLCDLVITDLEDELQEDLPVLLVASSPLQFSVIQPGRVKVNYNFYDDMINAISILIDSSDASENTLSAEQYHSVTIKPEPEEIENILDDYKEILFTSSYKDLFISTVPIDINKLYNSQSIDDLSELKNITHRLKGVFAMLNFEFLHNLCETLECHIAEDNKSEINKSIRELDYSVNKLVPQGNQ